MRIHTKYWITFIVIFAVHNIEEIVRNLPEWARTHGVLGIFPNLTVFTLATITLTIGAIVTAYILERHKSRKSSIVLQIFCWIMITNAIWHIGASLYHNSIMPGAMTSVIVLPVFGWLIKKAHAFR